MANVEFLKSVIYKAFPQGVIHAMNNVNMDKLEEIRIRAGNPIILKLGNNEMVLKYKMNSEEILNILQLFCSNSIYTYQNQICNGFITIPGGHRVGISGSVVIKDNNVINISNFFSMNIRVAREVENCSNSILGHVLDIEKNTILSTLIVSPPRGTEKQL